MPRAEVGTPKYLANKMKSKGLQRLRWYCQVCSKQCRDENAFKMHASSEGHMRQMLVIGQNANRHIADYSSQMQHDFVQLLSRRHGTNRVKANNVYQEYIQDKEHVHMNATRWVTLSEFVKHLGRAGIARVEETDKGWFIAWVDNSPKALAKAEANMKKEREEMDSEQRERKFLQLQIERAKEESGEGSGSGEGKELKRAEGETVRLSLGVKPPEGETPAAPAPAATATAPVAPVKFNVFKKPLLGGNALKGTLKSAPVTVPVQGEKRKMEEMSVAERLMLEDMDRKKRRV
ncbi:hypothetical protein DACRYDRAFT_65586 [Dacryopinax primogenitus]|uniref:DNA/RNA-binding protein Kin17 WH-like domain-containing protein n=1 Tax=Dacryopinax primogenitus (strain DJM 731) TaxID=1858805 RepID=M5G3W1_DACPD|nr:uncharacterized protein DACRYDRAFT_65586 [Dacryopinax primogenitus]EJU03364.1 hypothetical protein DACRYDRAFT_65586 [Dacryopinax primogenitus]